MFHTYVMAAHRGRVDMGRAQFLMDKTLLREAIAAMENERDNNPRADARYGDQWIWDYYCQRHYEKYNESFIPNVNPDWT
jgi:hypothetical protein